MMNKYVTTQTNVAIATKANRKAADSHPIIPRSETPFFDSTTPCICSSATCLTVFSDDGSGTLESLSDSADDVTPTSFGSIGLLGGTVGGGDPLASPTNAGAVSV
jgi:hypothetical protein